MNNEAHKTEVELSVFNGNINKNKSNILNSTFEQMKSFFGLSNRHEQFTDYSKFYTGLNEGLEEILKRRTDEDLNARITEYLAGDIPKHFKNKLPTLYFSRHIATPNYETLKFIEQTKNMNLPCIIGEDTSGKFVSVNETKRALAKLPIIKGINRYEDEIIENFTIVNFKLYQGIAFSKIKAKNGMSLTKIHHDLLKEIYPDIKFANESQWINRQNRENLLEHYKLFLSLFVQNGIMFEVYYPNDSEFIENILSPAFDFIQRKFGYKPLICKLAVNENINEREMVTYPSVIYPYLQKMFNQK